MENDIQLASAERDAFARIALNSANKVVYIVEVEDPFLSKEPRVFLALKMTESANYLDLVGYDISKNNIKETQNSKQKLTYQQALEQVEKGTVEVINIRFPWTRVISVRNVNYKHKSAK